MSTRLKSAVRLFLLQLFQYATITVVQRAASQGNVPVTFFMDFLYAGLAYAVIRKIQSSVHWWDGLAYALGSATGAAFGIWISLGVLGK